MASGEVSSITDPMTRGHAERLVPLIQETLVQARCDFPDVGLIATSVGPGAFTGLRIGLSTARALGLALNIPVVGVTTLAALAAAYFDKQPEPDDCLILIETKRTDFFGFRILGPRPLESRMHAVYEDGQPHIASARPRSMIEPWHGGHVLRLHRENC